MLMKMEDKQEENFKARVLPIEGSPTESDVVLLLSEWCAPLDWGAHFNGSDLRCPCVTPHTCCSTTTAVPSRELHLLLSDPC